MSDKMPDVWIGPSASADGYLCTLSHVNLPGWNRYVPAARIAELEAELERERMRIAACGVVAGANTRDSAAKVRQISPEYRSALLCDVERAVDREMAERERREAAEAELADKRGRREDIRANERRALRERLICAALTGLMRQTTAPEPWYAERAISQADAVLAALDREAAK